MMVGGPRWRVPVVGFLVPVAVVVAGSFDGARVGGGAVSGWVCGCPRESAAVPGTVLSDDAPGAGEGDPVGVEVCYVARPADSALSARRRDR